MVKLKLQYFGHPMQRADSFEKTLMMGKIEGGTENKMVGWYHRLNGHEFEQAAGDTEDTEVWHAAVNGAKEVDTMYQLNNNNKRHYAKHFLLIFNNPRT